MVLGGVYFGDCHGLNPSGLKNTLQNWKLGVSGVVAGGGAKEKNIVSEPKKMPFWLFSPIEHGIL